MSLDEVKLCLKMTITSPGPQSHDWSAKCQNNRGQVYTNYGPDFDIHVGNNICNSMYMLRDSFSTQNCVTK